MAFLTPGMRGVFGKPVAPFPFTNTQALDLDGVDDIVSVAATGDLGAFSIWFKPDVAIDKDFTRVFLAGFEGSWGCIVLGSYTGSVVDEIITVSNDDLNDRSVYKHASESIDTSWHHLVINWDSVGGVYEIWLDGVSKQNGSTNVPTEMDIDRVEVGRRAVSTDHFAGLVSQYSTFEEPLTSAEVASLYNSGVPVNPRNVNDSKCSGAWLLEEGSGSTASDDTDAGNDATITGGAWVTDVP